MDALPTPIEGSPALAPVPPPPGSPDHARRQGGTSAAAPAAPAQKATPLPVERLAFRPVGRPLTETVTLDYPFEWKGELVSSITVRRLTVAEVSELVEGGAFETERMWAIYAAQSGLPAGVLRGMMEDDGDRVVEANRRFLPRAFAETLNRTDAAATSSPSIPETGDPTSPA